jgi:peptide/nickel transport system substrate-binding protein
VASHDDWDGWREGSAAIGDTATLSEWEEAAYAHARETALTRGKLLTVAGLGLGGLLLGPVVTARAETAGALAPFQSGTLILGRALGSQTLDPHLTTNVADRELFPQLFDTLVLIDQRGEIYPGLATAWSFNRDGRAVKFKLRRGVTFHDGTRFDANAVKFSFDRWRDPKTASTTAAALLGPLASVVVDDQYTVKFLYEQPFPPVFVNLASPSASVVSQAAVAKFGSQFGRNPVGTGPYKFREWRTDGTISMERNPAHKWATPFYKDPRGKPLNRGPVIDAVEVRLIPEESTRVAALNSRQLDLLAGFNSVPVTQVAKLKANRAIQVKQVAGGTTYILLNAGRAPLTDPRVRRAISYAINRRRIVALALSGQAKPASTVLGSAYPDWSGKAGRYTAFNPTKAKALLVAAGQAGGFTIDLTISGGDTDVRVVQLVQQDLAKVGIRLNIHNVPVPVYVEDILRKPLPEKSHAFLAGTTVASGADGGSLLKRLFYTGGIYAVRTADPQLDALLDRQAAILNRARRRAAIAEVQELMGLRAYAVPLYEPRNTLAARTNVGNVRLDWQGLIHFQELTRR